MQQFVKKYKEEALGVGDIKVPEEMEAQNKEKGASEAGDRSTTAVVGALGNKTAPSKGAAYDFLYPSFIREQGNIYKPKNKVMDNDSMKEKDAFDVHTKEIDLVNRDRKHLNDDVVKDSAACFFRLCRLTVQPPQSYSVGGQRSSGQLTGKPAGARPDYRGRWCAVS
ncbi:UNVERIFIED_CONTAM: hypothetical protein FKN15_049792 [Acipenser sinensis]